MHEFITQQVNGAPGTKNSSRPGCNQYWSAWVLDYAWH